MPAAPCANRPKLTGSAVLLEKSAAGSSKLVSVSLPLVCPATIGVFGVVS
jgi:hypothetical protein